MFPSLRINISAAGAEQEPACVEPTFPTPIGHLFFRLRGHGKGY